MFEFLRQIAFFSGMPDEDLERLCEMIEEVRLAPGQLLFSEGSMGDRAYIIKEGQLEIIKEASGREVLLAVRQPGEMIGEMSLLEGAPRVASVRARTDTTLLAVSQEQFDELLKTSPSASAAILHTVMNRLRSMQAVLQQSEKMAQVGTMTAGIAHELNNPAAAVQRGAGQLRDVSSQVQRAFLHLVGQELSAVQFEALLNLEDRARSRAREPIDLDALIRSDREVEIETWLEEHGVPDAWEFAPTLVSLAYDDSDLENLTGTFGQNQLADVVAWLGGSYELYSLMEEIHQGAGRIAEIVRALKSYVYLDQAPVQSVDLHEGLDNTLVLLRNRLKGGINVRREYASVMPRIQAYGSELNQVWTNLIDNAIDALDGQGDIILRTKWDGDWVVVEVEDNGPGIPPEIQSKIFDPFFTTKPPGMGTGLGLNISYNIIVYKHKGEINVFSQPGLTRFQVRIPVNLDEVGKGAQPTESIARHSDEKLRQILDTVHTLAVVGLSAGDNRPSHGIASYLKDHGYRIIPVNPNYESLLGEKSYASLTEIPEPVDEVLIFRRSEAVPPLVEQAIQIGAKVVWMQEGIIHEDAAQVAQQAGLDVVMDTCMRATHRRLMQNPANH